MTLLAAVAYGMAANHSKAVELLNQLPEQPLTTGIAVVILLLLYQSDIDHQSSWYTRITALMQSQGEQGTLTDLYLAITDLDDDELTPAQAINIKNSIERTLTDFFYSDEVSTFEKTLFLSCRPVLKRVLAKGPQIVDAGVVL
ncbi:MAG: hypothetical protein SFW36_10865 [Leptolyngbyaceae cyanobacterium bins.59]|nr:hypothetical protein [Leptolyngbyaceae cyanobacterium bins.59]